MKGFFKHKAKTPNDLVRATKDLLLSLDNLANVKDSKREEKLAELSRNIREIKYTLYGNSENDPIPDLCAQLTQEIFQLDVFKLMIFSLPKLDFEVQFDAERGVFVSVLFFLQVRKDVAQIVANLQRQQVHSRVVASDYLERNKDILDVLIAGYENPDIALHYGTMLRECIRHQSMARYVLESRHLTKFFDYIELPNFAVASDAAACFKELLTRHKSTVADFLTKNYQWFFQEYNSKLLESPNYITRRQAVKLLGDILLDRSNASVMMLYVSSKDNLRLMMNLLRDPSKSIQLEAFHVFKVFVANTNKPPEIVSILVANRSKLLRFLSDFKTEKEDEQFDQDKAQVVKEIVNLEPKELA